MLPAPYTPCDTEVQTYHRLWENLPDYCTNENALQQLFTTYPSNTSVWDVLIKCTTLNVFYSAGVLNKDLHLIAQHIVSLNIDTRLQNGDWSVVEDIADCPQVEQYYYSFATKYCNFHNPADFPIYDYYVEEVVYNLKKQHQKIQSFKNRYELKDYTTFGKALVEICNIFPVPSLVANNKWKINFKELDRYFWLLGKSFFAKSQHKPSKVYKSAKSGSYTIKQIPTGTIEVTKLINGKNVKMSNTIDTLRAISNCLGFQYSPKWNTQTFGRKLIAKIKTK